MKFIKSKKGLALVTVLVIAAVAAVSAYAYFTAAGGGSGSFSTGDIGSITITSGTVGPLYPQTDPTKVTPVTVHVKNNGASDQYVGDVTGVVTGTPTDCDPSWFTVATVPAPGLLPPGTSDFQSSVILNDNGHSQNACASADLTITWSSAAGS
jgi:hypothetical protein